MTIRIAIDTGGTFTDLVAYDQERGTVRTAKQPSTPNENSAAIIATLREAGVMGPEVTGITIGTTVGTNAVLERKGARVLFVTTAGFEDLLFIQRLDKERLYDLHWKKPRPLVARVDCVGIQERVDHQGNVSIPLDSESLNDLVAATRARPGIEAIAVCLLFSYLNPSHEEAIGEVLAREFPGVPISLSSHVSPVWREYERASTTVADAYIKPVLQRYIGAVDRAFGSVGVTHPWNLLKSNGGYMSSRLAPEKPVSLLLSGLAGGVIAAKHFGDQAAHGDLLTIDMGGTSCDVGVIRDGQQLYANEFNVEFGVPITIPRVLVNTIGAGGGSIAWQDRGGFLHVGPRSAGAVPGPASYGTGGEHPTVTDADLLLGRLNPSYFLGGRMPLDVEKAAAALAPLAAALGLDTPATAQAVIETTDENMANALRLLTVEQGIDPREFALMAFGGAGPVHAREVARKLGITRVLIPPHPGLCSAFGALIADPRVDRVLTGLMRSDALDVARVLAAFRRLEAEALDEIAADAPLEQVRLHRSIDMRYAGQNYEREVVLPDAQLTPESLRRALGRFAELHRAQYGFAIEHEVIELVNFRVTAIGKIDAPSMALPAGAAASAGPVSTRDVYFRASRPAPCPIFRRDGLPAGRRKGGPLVIEEPDSTIVVFPEDVLEVTPSGVIAMTIGGLS